jgi:hypothetical protein
MVITFLQKIARGTQNQKNSDRDFNNNKRSKPMNTLSVLAIMFTTVAATKTTVIEQGWASLFAVAVVLALVDFFNKE